MAGWQDAPVVGQAAPVAAPPASASDGGGWQSAPIVGGASAPAKAASTPNPDNDYSGSPLSALGRTFESSADWGVGDLIRAAATGKKPSETAAQSSAAAASLPWYIRYPTEALGYGAGLVNLLDPATDLAEAGVAGLVGGKGILSSMAKTAAEGATAGTVSHVAGSDDPGLADTGAAALGGAALGGAAGAVRPLVNKGLTATMGKAASVDPDAAIANTLAAKDAAAATARGFTTDHTNADNAIYQVLNGRSPSQESGTTDSFAKTVQNVRDAINAQGALGNQVNGDDLNSWARQLKEGASNGIDGGLANDMAARLKGTLGTQPGGTAAWENLNEAARQHFAAQDLKSWGQTLDQGVQLGQQPLNVAKKFYSGPGDEQQYATMAGLTGAGGSAPGVGWMLPHILGTGLSFAGEHLFGVPGAIAGELGGYIGGKKLLKSYNKSQGRAGLQAAYPGLTGQQPTGGQTGPQMPQGVGDSIRNLAMGMAY